jgi:carboxyl-terminal processing protease
MKWAKWLVLVFLLAGGGAAALRVSEKPQKPVPFASLSQRDRNLAVYDAFVDEVREHYYDAKLIKSDEWHARFEEFRIKAAAAADSSHLYSDVLQQLAHQFPDSHVDVMWPPAPAAANPPASAPGPKRNAGNPGFEFVALRRGTRVNFMVGDVDTHSLAERAGVAPGYAIQNLAIESTPNGSHLKAEFERHPPDEVRSMETDFHATAPTYTSVPATQEAQTQAFLADRRFTVEYDYEPPPVTPPFEHRLLADGVTYVRFDSFNDVALIDRVLNVIDNAPANGLIVDLRHNRGGLSTETHRVLNRLLGHDAYIGTHRRGWWFENLRTDKEGPVYTGTLVVLIGPQSSSAAEITAAAVLDNHRGLLIGRMTNGSVMESNDFPLPDGGAAQIPVHDFVRGHDRRIDGVGIAPDIWILPTLEDVRAGRDPVMERAVQEIRSSHPGSQ